ncbi:MAG TPA: cupin domain-containing protein [Tepidisphaeraceae bacterium]|jgi:quercetin dioxygenase-like cupin family protein
MKRKSLLYLAVAGLAGGIVGIAPLTGRTGEASAQPTAEAPAPGAPEAKVKSLLSKDLKEFPGKEGLMITVEYPPGSEDPVHRHNAHAFVYVLEGSIVMQVKGGKEVTLKPGDTFYEGPDDVHTVGRNASKTDPAKFVVFFVKDKGAPLLIPVK